MKKIFLIIIVIVGSIGIVGCAGWNKNVDAIYSQYQANRANYIELRKAVYGDEADSTAAQTKVWIYLGEKQPDLQKALIAAHKDLVDFDKKVNELNPNDFYINSGDKVQTAFNLAITAFKIYNTVKK